MYDQAHYAQGNPLQKSCMIAPTPAVPTLAMDFTWASELLSRDMQGNLSESQHYIIIPTMPLPEGEGWPYLLAVR